MDERPQYRTLVEGPEYTALFDILEAKYSSDVLRRALAGVMWGIATNPQAFDRVLGTIRIAKTQSLGLSVPAFKIFFQIENEGQDDEHVLLYWIEESTTATDEAAEYLM